MGLNHVNQIIEFVKHNEIKLQEKILEYHNFDIAQALLSIDYEQRKRIYHVLTYKEIAEIFAFIEEENIMDLLNDFSPKMFVSIISEMNIDEAVDIFQLFPKEDLVGYLNLLRDKDKEKIQSLLQYSKNTAGSLMTTAYIQVKPTDLVKEAMKKMISSAKTAEMIYTIYVVNDLGYLQGTLSLKELILADKDEKISDLMNKNVITCSPTLDQEEVADIFKDYDFYALPVIDHMQRILGIITIDDIVDVIEEEANEDYSRFAAVLDVEIDSNKETVIMSVKKRIPWLLALALLGFITATIIASFEETISNIPTIALFMTLITGIAGNSGTQSLAVTVRGLNSKELYTKKLIWKHLIREAGTGLLNGIILGVVLFGVIYAFLSFNQSNHMFYISFVVGISVLISLTVSTLFGALIPIIINAFHIDPAVASGPFVSIINDILTVTIYFTLATIIILNTF